MIRRDLVFLYDTFSVIGGDLRSVTLARLLKEDGKKVKIYGFDKGIDTFGLESAKSLKDALSNEVIILPVPATKDNITVTAPFSDKEIYFDDIFSSLGPFKLVLAGHVTNELLSRFDREGIVLIDYLSREEMKVKNAVPTAEGAIGIAISELPITLSGANILIVGYGRIGKVLLELLKAFSSNITVSARRCGDFAWIESKGARAIKTSDIKDSAKEYDIIFNTVPAMVLGNQELSLIKDDALIVDLASVPGGIDLESAKYLGKKVIWALSLPGKVAPISAGKIIKETVVNILSELEVM